LLIAFFSNCSTNIKTLCIEAGQTPKGVTKSYARGSKACFMDDLLREFLTETGESLDTVDNQLVRSSRAEQRQDSG